MSWLSTENMLDITDFNSAKWFYENTKEIRNKPKSSWGVPLNKNRRDYQHKALYKLSDDEYGLRLYDTDVIRIHRCGNVRIDLSYPSQTTNRWAEYWMFQMTGSYVHVWSEKNCISLAERVCDEQHIKKRFLEMKEDGKSLEDMDSWLRDRIYFYTDDNEFTLMRSPEDMHRWTVDYSAPRYVKRVDKSGAHEARKPLQPFLQYLKMFESMPMTREAVDEILDEGREKYGWHTDYKDELVDEPDNQELWAYAAAYFHESRQNWDSTNGFHFTTSLEPMRNIKTRLYQAQYTKQGLNGYHKIPFGTITSAETYSLSYVESQQ